METKYPTLRRPKRKLCYLTNKESVTKQWQGTLTLGDVDKMFDDLDSCSEDDLFAPSLMLQTSDCETNQSEREASPVPQEAPLTKIPPICQMGPKGDVLLPATMSPSPNLDIDLDIPFDVHGPVKTSSPIEDNVVVESLEVEGNEKKQVEPPIFFDCEDDIKEDTKTQKPQSDGHIKEDDDCELESPPSAITFSKSMMSSHKNKLQGSCKESQPVREKTHKITQIPVMEGKRKTARQESESEPTAPEKRPKSVHGQPPAEMSTRVGKDMTAFLQKLRDARQPKPACFRKSLSPVKDPNPPEPEDDFLILEDDTPFCFSIPSKTATSKRQQQSRTSSTDKDSSTDKGTKDSALETAQKEEEPEKASAKLRVQPVNQKMKKKKGKEKNEVSGPGNDEDDLASPEDPPAGDMVEPEQPNKTKQQRLKKIPSKESDKAKEEPKDTVGRKPDEEEPTQKVEKKSQKSSEMKSSKLSEDGKEKAKTSKAKSLKGTRKARQGPEDIKETVYDEAVEEQSREQKNKKHADGRDLGSPSDKEMMNSDAQTAEDLADGKTKQNTLSVVSEGSLSEESQILGKRKRKQTGQWWLSGTQSAEETKATDNQPTLKKSKQHNKEPSATEPSPVKAKKDRPLKKRNQKQPAPSSSQSTTLARERKPKQNKKGGVSREKTKAVDEVFNTIEAEQFEEQQQQEEEEVPDHDLDPVHSSPLVLAHRDLSLNPGEQLFQRVYNHVSGTPGCLSPRRPLEKHRAAGRERRSRKPPGNWWTVNDMSEDVGSTSSQPQQLNPKEPKPRKDRKKQSRSPRLGAPKNGNMLVSSKPLGGAHVSPLKVKPLSAPKTVKRSLAMFKEIFTSGAETPTVLSSRDKGQNNTHNVNAPPAEEVTVTDCYTVSRTDKEILSLDASEFRSSQNSSINHGVPQDKCQPENTLKDFRSGPSSMIELAEYEESDSCLPSSRVHAALSVSDLCAPPLKPLTLQPKDKANLTEWFRTLWSTTVNSGTDITPDQFDWYFYQGRAIGVLADLNCGSICNGKILLGSYMKKPLLVDHSATTVFNLLTSSVNVTINGIKSHFNPGQSFMVQCGHAYSIQNVTAQPAVLYFTRISAESSD
ncbi:protein piccolo [Seriola aureovittata]|uniref:protein piccolo n=1 Tax=Seriola aureovittata TaxID=2871759 RepID=UPI0024BE6F4B|nr:protein piccolo [Seriola aureovittata]